MDDESKDLGIPFWRMLPDEVRTEIDQELRGFLIAMLPGFDPKRVPAHVLFAVGLWCTRELIRLRDERRRK